MVETGYLRSMGLQLGESAVANAARAKKAQIIRLGSGLDALMTAPDEEPMEDTPKVPRKKENRQSEARGSDK